MSGGYPLACSPLVPGPLGGQGKRLLAGESVELDELRAILEDVAADSLRGERSSAGFATY